VAATPPSVPATVDWVADLGACRALLNAGQFGRGEALSRSLHARAQAAGAHETAACAALLLAKLKANASDPAKAADWARQAIDAAVEAQLPYLQASAWVVLASASAEADRPVAALNAIGRAMSLVDDGTPLSERRGIFTGITITYNALGLSQQALPAARRAFEAELGDPGSPVVDRVRTRWNLLVTGTKAFDQLAPVDRVRADTILSEMRVHAEPLLADAEASGVPGLVAGAAHAVGVLWLRDGRLADALKLLQQSVDTQTEEPPAELRERWVDLAQAQARLGDAAGARRSAEQAAAWHVQVDTAATSQDLPVLCALEELLGRPERALALHRRLHAAVVHNLITSLESQIADLGERLDEQALRLENADLRERATGLAQDAAQANRLARTDALTGLPNRRAVEWAFAGLRDRDAPFALLLTDIDHFKAVNDRFSHAVGDLVLSAVGALLSEGLRGFDSVGRFGGEEFVVLLSNVDATAALAIAQRLRQRVEQHDWERLSPGLRVTVSGGLVVVRPGEGLTQALARADVLLYRAKDEGRNRIAAAGSQEP
jgi:diguanylate cyclase (GGDEF)-like protein